MDVRRGRLKMALPCHDAMKHSANEVGDVEMGKDDADNVNEEPRAPRNEERGPNHPYIVVDRAHFPLSFCVPQFFRQVANMVI